MANEKRLIDAYALGIGRAKREAFDNPAYADGWNSAISIIENAPTVDAVEVVRGRWLYDIGSGKYFCSACGEEALSFKKDTLYGCELYEVCLTDYCPNCGADMREREAKDDN